MHSSRVSFRPLAALVFAVFAFSAASLAQEAAAPKLDLSSVRIKNFGQMDERFYRGAEPKKLEDFEALKQLGISTVIDLQAKPEPEEKGRVESLGMRYVNIPMVEKTYPTEGQVEAFMKLVDDSTTGKFYVHCAGGRHRTGAMGAVYRFNRYGWDFDRVYAEMKQFDFYTRFGHGDYKRFVEDYWQRVQTHKAGVPAAQTPSGANALMGN